MEQNSISGFNSDQESFQNSGEGTKLKPFNTKLDSFNVICAKNRSSHRGAWPSSIGLSTHFECA